MALQNAMGANNLTAEQQSQMLLNGKLPFQMPGLQMNPGQPGAQNLGQFGGMMDPQQIALF